MEIDDTTQQCALECTGDLEYHLCTYTVAALRVEGGGCHATAL